MEERRVENDKRWEAAQALEKEKINVMKDLINALSKKDKTFESVFQTKSVLEVL